MIIDRISPLLRPGRVDTPPPPRVPPEFSFIAKDGPSRLSLLPFWLVAKRMKHADSSEGNKKLYVTVGRSKFDVAQKINTKCTFSFC